MHQITNQTVVSHDLFCIDLEINIRTICGSFFESADRYPFEVSFQRHTKQTEQASSKT